MSIYAVPKHSTYVVKESTMKKMEEKKRLQAQQKQEILKYGKIFEEKCLKTK